MVKRQTQRQMNRIFFWGSIILLLLASVAWRLKVLDGFPLGYDEGIHLIVGKLWAAGFIPYQEIFVSYPPVFIWSLGLPWEIFRQAIAAQLLMVIFTLTGVLAVIYLGTVYHSRLSGIIAGILLSFASSYFLRSFQVMAEVPSIGLAAASVALAEKYRRGGSWPWVVLSGSVLAFGLSLKVLPVYAIPLVGLMVIFRWVKGDTWADILRSVQRAKGVLFRDVGLLAGSFLVVFCLPILLSDLPAFYDQVVGMRMASREVVSGEAQPYVFRSNNEAIVDFLFSNPGITALALYGLVFVAARQVKRYAWLFIWLGLVWGSMYFHIPLRAKHLPIFLPPLVLFAGFAAPHILDFLKEIRKREPSPKTVGMLAVILVVGGMVLWRIPGVIAENNGADITPKDDSYEQAITFIRHISGPDDCVAADDPVFLHETDRLPPPELAETSQTRIDTGFLTLSGVVDALDRHRCHAVAIVTRRFDKSISGLPEWLADTYLAEYDNGDITVHFARRGADDDYVPVPEGRFANVLRLYGLKMSRSPWPQNGGGYVSLFWELEALLPSMPAETLTLRHPDTGQQVYRLTRFPFEGHFNPAAWGVGQKVKDTFWLNLPADLPAGVYEVYFSVCDPETAQCLAVNNVPAQTELHLGRITLVARR